MRPVAYVALMLLLGAGSAWAIPPGPPPKVSGTGVAPPPAWIEGGKVEKWLAYSSYCWKTACVDFIPPPMRTDVPKLVIRRGQTTELHFRFVPTRVTVTVGGGTRRRLTPSSVVPWRPRAAGIAVIATVAAAGGDASYLVRIRWR